MGFAWFISPVTEPGADHFDEKQATADYWITYIEQSELFDTNEYTMKWKTL